MTQGFARTDDGLELFYRVVGTGGPALVCCNGIGVSTFFWEYLVEHFAPRQSVVIWDYRAHGRSGTVGPQHRLDIPRHARDLGTVIDHLGLDRPVLLGHSMGTQVILERYRQAPENVGGLVSVLGTYGHPLDTFRDLPFSRELFDVLIQLNESFPRTMDTAGKVLAALPVVYDVGKRLGMVDGSRLSRDDLRQYLHHLTILGFPLFFRIAREMGEHTARDLLPDITAPALVIAAEFDDFTPPRLAEELHQRLPDSEMVMLAGASHAGIVEQPEVINTAVEVFLAGRVAAHRKPKPRKSRARKPKGSKSTARTGKPRSRKSSAAVK